MNNLLVQGKIEGAIIGTKIKSLIDFSGVPAGTQGIIDENYENGFMVAWDLPQNPLPKNYKKHDGRPAFISGLLRDGFSYEEANFLEIVSGME